MFPIDYFFQLMVVRAHSHPTIVVHQRIECLLLVNLDQVIVSCKTLPCYWGIRSCGYSSPIVSQLVDQICFYRDLF